MKMKERSAAVEYSHKFANPRVLLAIPKELESLYYEDLAHAFRKGYELNEYEIFGIRVIAVEDEPPVNCEGCCFSRLCQKFSEHLSLVGQVPCKGVDNNYERYFVRSSGLSK